MKNIMKIPEQGFKNASDYWMLPCASTYSVIQIYDNFFTIMSILYNRSDIKKDILDHIRSEYSYYKKATYLILGKKKLDLIDWLANMDRKELPADEICLMAGAKLLNIQISVDYITGTWTTFETLSSNHDYILEKSTTHFIYRGSCTYNLLCPNDDLKTTGRKLMDYKMFNMKLLKPLCISLDKLEDYCTSDITTQFEPDSDITEIYHYTDNAELGAEATNYSDSTEIYYTESDIEIKQTKEKAIFTKKKMGSHVRHGTTNITTTKNGIKNTKATNSRIKAKLLKPKKQSFLCGSKNCTMRSNSRKELYMHYKTCHKRIHKCKKCNKQYKTPYSLKQHTYKHRQPQLLLTCNKCNKTFVFKNHLKIHRNSHTIDGKYECPECYSVFKYKHDMYRHLREHTAEILECNKCDYTGTMLNLKEHKRQHYNKFKKFCPLCNRSFKFRIELWRHKQHCRRSDSPEY